MKSLLGVVIIISLMLPVSHSFAGRKRSPAFKKDPTMRKLNRAFKKLPLHKRVKHRINSFAHRHANGINIGLGMMGASGLALLLATTHTYSGDPGILKASATLILTAAATKLALQGPTYRKFFRDDYKPTKKSLMRHFLSKQKIQLP